MDRQEINKIYEALLQMALLVSREQSAVLEIAITQEGMIAHMIPRELYGGEYDEDEDDFNGNYE